MEGSGGGTPMLQYLAAGSSNLAIVSSGMHYGWPSPSLPQLNTTNSTIRLSPSEGSWMAVMPLVGAVVGALLAANIVDFFGRKKTIIGTSVPFLVAWVMIALASHAAVLHVARFLAGIADGVAFTVVPMYVGEIADAKVRGQLGSSCSFLWILGYLIINVIGSYLSITNTAIVSSIVPIVSIVTFVWMPESPYYLLMRRRVEDAKDSLKKFRKKSNVDDEIERINTSIKSEVKSHGRFLDLFTVSSNRRALIIIVGLRGFQQFSGTTAINFYLHKIFEEAGYHSPHHASILYFSIMLLMTVVSSSIVDRAGRKPLLIISMSGSALALFLEGTYFYVEKVLKYDVSSYRFVPVVGLMFFVVIFSLGMQSIPICMLGELFPTSVKAYALCLADVYYSVVATLATKFLQIMKDDFGIHAAFYGFTLCSLIGLAFIVFFVPETKGKNLEEIQRFLKGESDSYREEGKSLNVKEKRIDIKGSAEKV